MAAHQWRRYIVVGYANRTNNPRYPRTIIYMGYGGRVWSRPADDWHRSMTVVAPTAALRRLWLALRLGWRTLRG